MALVLNIKVGSGFWLTDEEYPDNDVRFVVESILSSREFVLRREGTDYAYRIGRVKKEVFDSVSISAGENTSRFSVRVLIDAPRDLKVLRDKLYEKAYADQDSAT